MNFVSRQPMLVTVKRAAWLIGRSKGAIYELIIDGRLDSTLVDGKRRVLYASVERLVRDFETLEQILDKGRLT